MKKADRIEKQPFTWTIFFSNNYNQGTLRININIKQISVFLILLSIMFLAIISFIKNEQKIKNILVGYQSAANLNYLQKHKVSINLQKSNQLKQKLRDLRKKENFMRELLHINNTQNKEFEVDLFAYPQINVHKFTTQKGEYAQVYINNKPVITFFDEKERYAYRRADNTQRNLQSLMAMKIKDYKFHFKKQDADQVIAYINNVEIFRVASQDINEEEDTLTVAKNWMSSIKTELRLEDTPKQVKAVIPILDKEYRKNSFLHETINKSIEYPIHTSLELSYLSEPKVNNINKTLILAKNEVEKFNHSTAQLQETIQKYKNRFSYTPSIPPVRGSYVLSPFGWRMHPILRSVRFHTGIDMPTWGEAPIYATASGQIKESGWAGGYGNFILLDHGYGFETAYGHNSKLLVAKGSFVKKGQIIAYSGMTGLAKGIHTHYEVRYFGRPINPINYLSLDLFDASKNW